jgi:hypothetical protein
MHAEWPALPAMDGADNDGARLGASCDDEDLALSWPWAYLGRAPLPLELVGMLQIEMESYDMTQFMDHAERVDVIVP